jgi:hypothetical protein
MNVATHVAWSNRRAASRELAQSTADHAAAMVARNAQDQYKDHMGFGENMAANAAMAPYSKR